MSRQASRVLALGVLVLGFSGCERLFGTMPKGPERVGQLEVVDVAAGSAVIQWTQVDNGAKRPAHYLVVVGAPAAPWSESTPVGKLVDGSSIGSPVAFVAEDLDRATVYSAYVVAFRAVGDSVLFSEPSVPVIFTTAAFAPEDIEDVAVGSFGETFATVAWTEVDDGAGRPANYLVRYGTPSVAWPDGVEGAIEVMGTKIGASLSFTAMGLQAGSQYQFRVASTRGRVGDTTFVVGAPSPTVTIVTASPPPPPPPPPPGAPPPPTSTATPFFFDDFETGARRSDNGFTWATTGNRVSVSNERSFSGSFALRFRFGPDTLGQDSSAEQRFNMGRYLAEYWVDYMLFIPSNFVHRADSPSNNKFFMTWRDTYSDAAGGTWRIGYEYSGTSSTLRPMSSRWDLNSWTSSGLNHPQQGVPLIGGVGPLRVGQWNRVRLQFRAASSRTDSDGVMRMWINEQLFAELTTGRFHNFYATPADALLRNGYFLGWANSGFSAETIFFIDDVRFFDANPGWLP